MEYRKVFDKIPDQFDKFRPRYSAELFADLISYAGIGPDVPVLEIGPGTGQATDPILDTGCDYHAIELGEHLYEKMKEKYGSRSNLLKPGGTLAMMLTSDDYRTPNEALYNRIQEVYANYFKPEARYTEMHAPCSYTNAPAYGYVDFERREYYGKRVFTADEYVSYCGTHCTSLVIPEPYKSLFFNGLKEAVLDAGNRIVFNDTYVLYLAKKPQETGKGGAPAPAGGRGAFQARACRRTRTGMGENGFS